MANDDRPAAASGTFLLGGDLPVHRLGFGAMRITGTGIWGPPADHDEAVRVLRRAVELGVTFIDTANSYGPEVSEELIAEALHPYPDDVVIATKGGLVRPGPDQWEANGQPDYLRGEVEGSLRRLKVDRIDLYQFHRPDPRVPIEDSIGALKELQDAGKIRHLGVSNVSVQQLAAARAVAPIVSVQNIYSVGNRRSDAVLDVCERDGLAFIPWRPVADNAKARKLGKAATAKHVTSTQLALAWLLHRSPVILPIPGTSKVSHLEENMGAAAIDLTPAEVDKLAA